MKSNIIEQILSRITPEKHAEIERDILETMSHSRWMEENGLKYNTPTSPSLTTLREYGFNPTKITSFFLEETFLFNTKKEANSAYKKLEKELGLICGWFYSEKDFYKELEEATKPGSYYEYGHPTIYEL